MNGKFSLYTVLLLICFSFGMYASENTHSSVSVKNMSADDAWDKLIEGNTRFVEGKAMHPNQNSRVRKSLTKGQNPFVIVISCSDSRVPPEIIFDQGLGDIFPIRVAGNVVDDIVLGSIEYAVEHIGTKLIVVLGHESCGAVTATVNSVGKKVSKHIDSIVEAIMPAVEKASKISGGDKIDNAVKENIRLVRKQLHYSEPVITEYVKNKGVKVIGARYDLDRGVVEKVR